MRYLLLFIVAGLWSCENQTYQIGKRLYKSHCADCHMDQGEGLKGLIPPLAGSDYLGKHLDQLPCLIRNGLEDTIVVNGHTYMEKMPDNKALSEIQITNILNYVNSSWGNKEPTYQLKSVRELLNKCR
jgi:mono/diheme cytochrome c family protein